MIRSRTARANAVLTLERASGLLAKLVRCPSVNPCDRTPLEPPFGEGALAELLAGLLTSWGGDVHVRDVYPGRPNVWAVFAGRDPSRTILFDAHSDTVSHLAMTIDPFGGDVRNGRLYGRGATDTKGPMASMLLAIEAALAGKGLACNVVFAATCDEENGAAGARALAESGLGADLAVAAEATDLKIVCAHKGIQRARVTIRGKAAHSSTPQLGRNAIYAMSRLVTRIERLAADVAGRPAHPRLGTRVLSVSTIEGGTAMNVIPDRCEIQIDRRTLPGETDANVRAEIESLVFEPDTEGCTASIEWLQTYPPMETDPAVEDIRRLEAAVRAHTDTADYGVAAYGTDAAFYAERGIPGVVFGPGNIADAHTADESIELAQVVLAARILHTFLS